MNRTRDIDSKGCNQWKQDKTRSHVVITEFLGRTDKGAGGWTDDTGLWGDGLGLDSLEAAELSAMLEDEFGSDPFSAGGDLPETVGDIVAFYAPFGPNDRSCSKPPPSTRPTGRLSSPPRVRRPTASCSKMPGGWRLGCGAVV